MLAEFVQGFCRVSGFGVRVRVGLAGLGVRGFGLRVWN